MRSALPFVNTVRRQQQRASAKHYNKKYRQQHNHQQQQQPPQSSSYYYWWSRRLPSADRVALWAVAAALSIQLLDAALQPTYDARDSTTAQMARDDSVSAFFVSFCFWIPQGCNVVVFDNLALLCISKQQPVSLRNTFPCLLAYKMQLAQHSTSIVAPTHYRCIEAGPCCGAS